MPTALETAVKKPVIVRVGRVRPSLLDTITLATGSNNSGPALDLSQAKPEFSMRPLQSRIPIIEGANARGFSSDEDGFNVAYDWCEEDVENAVGEYMGWWTFTPIDEDRPQDTPEFPIIITDHGPGEGVQTGAIVSGVAAEMPTTFAALKADIHFGDRFLQGKAELLKYKILGNTMVPDEEANLHPMLLDYFSKRLALELIRPAIDYWSRQHRTITTTQTSEIASYPEMVKSLEHLDEMLREACKELWEEIQFIVPGLPKRSVVNFPTSDLAGIPPVTKPAYMSQPLEVGLGMWWGDIELGVFPFP